MNRRLLGHAAAGLLLAVSVTFSTLTPDASPVALLPGDQVRPELSPVHLLERPVMAPQLDPQLDPQPAPRSESRPDPTPAPRFMYYNWDETNMVLPTRPPAPTMEATLVPYLVWPVGGGGTVTQVFHLGHEAVDIGGDCGTPVLAAGNGEVVWSGWKGNGGGIVIDIQLDNGLLVSYNHLRATYVGWGVRVSGGAIIGEMGMTGIATGCHLHFAASVGGVLVNPAGYW